MKIYLYTNPNTISASVVRTQHDTEFISTRIPYVLKILNNIENFKNKEFFYITVYSL